MPARDLLLLRHAHAERDHESGVDHERELSGRGRRDAAAMGRFLTAIGRIPDAVLTSTAARAYATAELAIEAGGWRSALHLVPSFYGGDVEGAIQAVRAHGGEQAGLLLIGHEPTWSALASALAGGGALRLPKAALAHLAFDLGGWEDLRPGTGVLRALVAPSLLVGLKAVRR